MSLVVEAPILPHGYIVSSFGDRLPLISVALVASPPTGTGSENLPSGSQSTGASSTLAASEVFGSTEPHPMPINVDAAQAGSRSSIPMRGGYRSAARVQLEARRFERNGWRSCGRFERNSSQR